MILSTIYKTFASPLFKNSFLVNCPASPQNKLIQPLPNAVVGIGQDVTIAIHGSLDRGVTQLALDEFDIFPLGDERGWFAAVKKNGHFMAHSVGSC